jgi:hypothetical protein
MGNDESGWAKLIEGTIDVVTKYKLLEKLAALFFRDNAVVLLCGTSGVGKSQFVLSLQDGVASPIPTTDRTRGWRRAKLTKEGRKFELLDTPGQVGEAAIRRQAHLEALKAKRFGIINVVANGYHEGTAPESHAIKLASNGYEVNPDFLAKNRQLEIDSLAEWSVELAEAKWLVTLVNKADLWWHPETLERVLEHYKSSSSPYGAALNHWQRKHVVLPYASTSKPYYDRVPMSGHFGDAQRLGCQVGAFRSLTELIEQAKAK